MSTRFRPCSFSRTVPSSSAPSHARGYVYRRSLQWAAYLTIVARSALREAYAARANPWTVALGIYLTHITYGFGTIVGWLTVRPCTH